MEKVFVSADDEYTALRNGCGLIEYQGIGLFRVSGPGAVGFLSWFTTRDVEFLLEEQISVALVLDEAGRVVSEVLVHCLGTDFLVEVWPAQRARTWTELRAAAGGRDGVSITDVSDASRVFGIEGPASFRIAQKFLPFPISSLTYRGFTTVGWNGHDVLLSRTGVTGEYGYKLHITAAASAELGEELRGLGAVPTGLDALNACRAEMRFANLEDESGGDPCYPFEVGLQWMVDLHHEFRGKQGLLGRIDMGFGQRQVCWVADQALIEPPRRDTALVIGGQTVGHVTHALRSPGLECVIGTARLGGEVAAAGLELSLSGPSAAGVRTVSAPYLLPSSFDVKPE